MFVTKIKLVFKKFKKEVVKMAERKIIKEVVSVPFPELLKKIALTIPEVQKELEASTSNMYCKEAVVEVKLTFSTKESSGFSAEAEVKGGFGLWSAAVNASYTRKYEFDSQVASTIKMIFIGIEPQVEVK